jgi:ubiquinone/menaquinone biosynthesis C-methylase UbiE
VEAVTARAVLIYVDDKHRAFEEFLRVLEPGGRLSIFEPINRFGYFEPPHLWWGFDVTPVMRIAAKVKEFYRAIQPPETDPMLNFDERTC